MTESREHLTTWIGLTLLVAPVVLGGCDFNKWVAEAKPRHPHHLFAPVSGGSWYVSGQIQHIAFHEPGTGLILRIYFHEDDTPDRTRTGLYELHGRLWGLVAPDTLAMKIKEFEELEIRFDGRHLVFDIAPEHRHRQPPIVRRSARLQ